MFRGPISTSNRLPNNRDLPMPPHADTLEAPSPSSSSAPNDVSPHLSNAHWIHEVGNFGRTRHSRASSIVSTRTRFSTTTLDDARSIDLHLGGHYFRISRDGSRITDAAPPPYSSSGTAVTIQEEAHARDDEIPIIQSSQHGSQVLLTPRTHHVFPDLQTSNLGANILNPSEIDMPSPIDDVDLQSRHRLDGPQERGFRSGLGGSQFGGGPQTMLASGSLSTPSLVSPLRRRNGIRLPALKTEDLTSPGRGPDSRPRGDRTLRIRSAGPILSSLDEHDTSPGSPTFIGHAATGRFPVVRRSPLMDEEADSRPTTATSTLLDPHDDNDDGNSPLAMESLNEISLHYTRMMRYLDRDHRRALHEKDKELAQLRERLNEVDTVYRQELRARDFIIDDLRKRLANIEEHSEMMLEKARYQVEDVWEARWKDRDRHLMERMKRIEDEAQKKLERASEAKRQVA